MLEDRYKFTEFIGSITTREPVISIAVFVWVVGPAPFTVVFLGSKDEYTVFKAELFAADSELLRGKIVRHKRTEALSPTTYGRNTLVVEPIGADEYECFTTR